MKTLMLPAPHPKVVARYEFEKYPVIGSLGLVRKLDVLELQNGEFVKVGTQEVAGVQAMLRGAFIVRAWVNIESKVEVAKMALALEKRIREESSSHSLMPSHPGWGGRTVIGKTYYHYLFAAEDISTDANSANSRLTRLAGHLDSRSRYLGKAVVKVMRDDVWSPDDRYTFKNYDGWFLVRPGFIRMPWNVIKLYGSANMGPGYVNGGAPTVKGVGEDNARLWSLACRKLNLMEDEVDIIIPEISMKFDDGRDMFAVDLFSVFDTVIGEHFTWTNQMLVNMARFFTPEFTRWVADRIIAQIRRREEAYSDLSGMAIASMLASESPELARLLDDDSDESAVEKARETISAVIGSIVSGLPFENSKYLKRTIDLVMGGLSRFYSPGCSDTVLPDERLKPGEITVNADVWKIMSKAYRKAGRELKLGSEVIIARHPNTGTEAAMCRVVGIGRTAVTPLWLGSRFNGDVDGDRIAICFAELEGISSFVDDSLVEEFIISIPESGKGKTNLTVAEAVAAGVYSQAMIPIADRYLRIANELGIPGDRIIHLIELLNNTIDSAKHDKSVDHAKALSLSGLDVNADTSYLQKILTGSLGSREYRVMNYNRYVDLAREERTSIEWANIVRESGVLFNIFPGSGDPDYSSTIRDLDITNISKGYKFEMVVDYTNCLRRHGLEEMVGVLKNHEPQATIPSEILGSSRGAALRERASGIGLLPRMTARRCFNSYKLFLENIRRGDVTTTQAYQPIRDAVTLVRESEHGDAAMKWLFASLAFNCDPNIRMKAMNILTYMPLKVGSYNLRKVLEFLGYERKFNLIITR